MDTTIASATHWDLVLAQQLLHQLGTARGLARVAVVEEQVHAPRSVSEISDLADPFLELLAGIVVVVSTAPITSPPSSPISAVETHVGVVGRPHRHLGDEVGQCWLVDRAVPDAVLAKRRGGVRGHPPHTAK